MVLLLQFSCSDDISDNTSSCSGELIVDSFSVFIVRGEYPGLDEPAGLFVWKVIYRFDGAPGQIDAIEFSPDPPGGVIVGSSNMANYKDPLPANTPHIYQDENWCIRDFSEYDSVFVYFAIDAKFWRQIESRIQDNIIIVPCGEDRWHIITKIDVRDE